MGKLFERLLRLFHVPVKLREKPKNDSIPKVKKQINNRWWKFGTWFVMFFIVFSGVFAWIKAERVSQTNHRLLNKVGDFQKQVRLAEAGDTAYSPAIQDYMDQFIPLYMNRPNNDDDMQTRINKLKPYFASNIDLDTDSKVGKASQQFKNATLFNITSVSGQRVAQYRVDYEIHTPKDQRKKVKVKVTKRVGKKHHKHKVTKTKVKYKKVTRDTVKKADVLLNIPYVQKGSQFTVVGLPYYTDYPDTVGHVGNYVDRFADRATLDDSKITQHVTDFTKDFLNKYVSDSKDDMKYLMADPQALNGKYSVSDITDISVYGTKKQPISVATLTLTDKDTDISHEENVVLYLQKQKGTFFVSDMQFR